MKTILMLCVVASLSSSAVYARVMATPGASSAVQQYDQTGLVGQIDVAGRTIIVNDKQYFFPSAVIRIHNANGGTTSAARLKKNTRIGFKTANEGPGGKLSIGEIWVLEEPTERKN